MEPPEAAARSWFSSSWWDRTWAMSLQERAKNLQRPSVTSCAGFLLAFHFQHILCHGRDLWPHHFLANACFGTASSSLSPLSDGISHIS